MPKIYLDMCCYCRPFDDQSQHRVQAEADAVLQIIDSIRSGEFDLVVSDVLTFELSQNSKELAVIWIQSIFGYASESVILTDQIEQTAEGIVAIGVRPKDALHVASAIAANTNYFCTCDDRLLKKVKSITGLLFQVVNPTDMVQRGTP
jgi:predicted nucleic acid-binding protein